MPRSTQPCPVMTPIKVAFLTTDNRDQLGDYDNPAPHFGTAPTALLDGFAQLGDQIEVHVISCAKKRMGAPPKLAPNIWFHQPIVPHLGWGRTAFLGCGLAVRKLLARIQPDLVHAQGTERDCGVSMMVAPRLPKVLTIHGHMARIAEITQARFPSYYWLASQLERAAIRKADGVLSLSQYTQSRIAGLARKSWVFPNAVDAQFFEVANRPEPRLALCVAGVHPWKRQVELIQALQQAPPESRPQLVFLGQVPDSEYGMEFRRLIEKNRTWCEHHGHVGRSELRTWLAKTSLLILPSIEDNCPMVVLEAMAAGVPSAAARIGGIPDLIQEGMNGVLFDPRDADEMTAKIISLTHHHELRETLAARCKSTAQERYHPLVIGNAHLAIYRELTGSQPSSATV